MRSRVQVSPPRLEKNEFLQMPRTIRTQAGREKVRAYGRDYYMQHAEEEKLRVANRKQKVHQWFEEYKVALACQRCGENHLAALDFHHRKLTEKDMSISQAVHNGWSIERILKEIEKCDVLCANCHTRLHKSYKIT